MRSTTFEVLGMALMALITILTCGVMMTWVYLRETGGGRGEAARPTGNEPEVAAARAPSSSSSPDIERDRSSDALEVHGSGDQRFLAGHH